MKKISLYALQDRTDWKEAVIVFKPVGMMALYNELERSYKFSRDNKYFRANAISLSIFASCLDGKDNGVKITDYIFNGDKEYRWEEDYCYIVS